MRTTLKSPSKQPPSPGPGRPRDGAFDARILDATLELLAEVGYPSMTLDHVAAKAGVSKPAIYRRWGSKAQLATAALARLQASAAPARSGDARADLVTLLASFRRLLLRPHGLALIGTLLAEEHSNPELIALFRERIVAARRAQVRSLLEEAAARGELRRAADLDAATNALIGSFYARYLSGERIGVDWPERVVALVWSGLAR